MVKFVGRRLLSYSLLLFLATSLAYLIASVALDPTANEAAVGGKEADISGADTRVRVFVIPTDEEWAIAEDTYQLTVAA